MMIPRKPFYQKKPNQKPKTTVWWRLHLLTQKSVQKAMF